MPAAVLERRGVQTLSSSHFGRNFAMRGLFLLPQTDGQRSKPRVLEDFDHNDTLVTRSLQKLNIHYPRSLIQGLHPRNAAISGLMRVDYQQEPQAIHAIASVLRETGALDLTIRYGNSVLVDGKKQPVAIVKAQESGAEGDMV